MAKQRTMAELAERERELTSELSELRAEIASRAGERDQAAVGETPGPPKQAKSAQKSAAKKATATDKAAENAENTSQTPLQLATQRN